MGSQPVDDGGGVDAGGVGGHGRDLRDDPHEHNGLIVSRVWPVEPGGVGQLSNRGCEVGLGRGQPAQFAAREGVDKFDGGGDNSIIGCDLIGQHWP
jgi:hypothetical protein